MRGVKEMREMGRRSFELSIILITVILLINFVGCKKVSGADEKFDANAITTSIGMLPPGTYTIKRSEKDEYGKVNPMDSRRINAVLESARLMESGGKYHFIDDTGNPQPLTNSDQVKGCIWLVMDKDGNGVSNDVYPANSPGKPIVGAMIYSSKDTHSRDIGGEFFDIFVRGEQNVGGSSAVKRINFLADHVNDYKMFTTHIEKK